MHDVHNTIQSGVCKYVASFRYERVSFAFDALKKLCSEKDSRKLSRAIRRFANTIIKVACNLACDLSFDKLPRP